ncbi:MAG: tetratricopeptide repeat protein [Planctomycetota bacterium]
MNGILIYSKVFFIFVIIVSLFAYCPIAMTQNLDLNSDSSLLKMIKEHSEEELRSAIKNCLNGQYKLTIPVISRFEKAGDLDARYVMAQLHRLGAGLEQSDKIATSLLESAANNDHGPSLVALANLNFSNAPAKALRQYESAAQNGETNAMIKMGDIAENGQLGMRRNFKRAFHYYWTASQQGNFAGDFHVARCYEKGIGVSPNSVDATRYYRKAALGGVRAANAILGRRYLEGLGVEVDPVAATGWFTRGAKLGSTEAMVLLGQEYESGKHMVKDLNQAGQLYSAAAKKNDPAGNYRLALLYLNGIGTQSDPVRAYVLLAKAQAIPAAQEAFEKLEKQLSQKQIEFAKKKIAESNQ